MNKMEILVYGAEILCASCVNAPSSIETASWLEAAFARRYNPEHFQVRFVDIFNPQTESEKLFSQRVIDEDLWYPVVVVEDTVISEGNPQLKSVFQSLEEKGLAVVNL